MARKRRPINDPLVTVEVPQSVANALRALTAEDILKLKHDRTLLHKVFKFVEFGLLTYLLVAVIYIFGISQSVYEKAVANCTSTMTTSTGITEERVNRICVDLTSTLKPSDKPLERLAQVWTWTSRPVEDVLGKVFIVGYEYKYIGGKLYTPASTELTTVDYSNDVDEVGNPSLKAVVQEAIRLQPEYDVPWRYVVDACFYESGGLRQYSEPGVLTQGVNKNPDGSTSSIDWGMCQTNDRWHPDLMSMAKGSWQGSLKAGFEVMSNGWVEASKLPESEYQRRLLWARYNGSGPYDLYADRVVKAHNALEPKIQQVLEELENDKKAPEPETTIGSDYVEITMDLAKDVPVYDGEAANIRMWAEKNPSWTVKTGQPWHFCAQTDESGWGDYAKIGDIEALGICANATQIDMAIKAFANPKLTVTESYQHKGTHPWFERVIDCPNADYVIQNDTGRDIVFQHVFDGDKLTLRVGYAQPNDPPPAATQVNLDNWKEFWSKCPDDHTLPCGYPLPGYPSSYITGEKGWHEGALDYFNAAHTSTPVYSNISGVVSEVGRFDNGGNNGGTTYMIITNASCKEAIYHMPTDTMLPQGSTVSWGDVVGQMGNEGQSDWIHIHYQIDCGNGPIFDQAQYWDGYLP